MCFGPLRRLCHWGPLTALGIIKIVTLMTIHCNSQWWPPSDSISGVINASSFLLLSTLTVYNFLSSVYEGPGLLPLGWKPADPSHCQYLQFCSICQGYKAPRSHHCKKCGRCVMKMDHHCPWINNCVGHTNHSHFTFFLFFAVCGCFQSTIVLSWSLYRAMHRSWYLYYGDGTTPIVTLSIYAFVTCIFALGLSIGVVLAVGMLLFFQLRAIIRNRTCVEDWILEKATHRRFIAAAQGDEMPPFIYPYDLGAVENIKQVLNPALTPVGDGITWRVVDTCDQYTLTREQIEQKNEKRSRARSYQATRSYSGSWLPLSLGWRVCCSPPCSDEYRLPLKSGDTVSVTRWRRHWLFGEKIHPGSSKGSRTPVERGWFPRCCVVEITGDWTADEHPKSQ